MINLSLNKQLDIIAPSTNRALGVVLQQATPAQLETISKDKDLKSIMNSLLKESTQSSQSDKTLLDLAKNNPTLKDLGNVSSTIKDLLQTLKSDKSPLPIETTLKNFLVDIKELDEPILKQKLENSGVFLESKLKDVKNPQVELKSLLSELDKSIAKSDIFTVKVLSEKIKELLNSPTLKEASNSSLLQASKDDPNALKQLAKGVESVLSKLQEHLSSADSTLTKSVATQLSKLENFISPKLLTPENFKLASITDTLQILSAQLSQSTNPHAKDLLESLTKVMDTLKEIEQNSTTPKTALDSLIEKKVPQDIKNITEPLKALIEKADPVFSKETVTLAHKLAPFSNPEKLASHENVKEILSGDLKSILLKASDEISKSSHPNQAELLKQIDKLSLQIDYYQLVSHLSNSSSLYLPFSWDSLEEGSINLKKDKEDKFYCDIDLKLKEYGELKLKLVLYDKNQINIQIYSNNSEFKEIIKENIGILRTALIESQITPREIRLFDALEKNVASPYEKSYNHLDLGFEVKA
ncbi:MAG: flagellar hook-length control protein FliK [Campylobacterales bacterium]|nr:flagellar hook-length control protein FliK [Campylobacterales bacterium]